MAGIALTPPANLAFPSVPFNTKSSDSNSNLPELAKKLRARAEANFSADEMLADNFRSIAFAEARVVIRRSAAWLSEETVEILAVLVSCE